MNLFEVYKLWDIEPVKGLDTTLWDKNGEVYTDLYGGHAVISVGHSHPHYVKMLSEQLGKLGFYSNAVQNSLQSDLAARLGKVSGYDDYKLFLCNSGAEANENALKVASFTLEKQRYSHSAKHSTGGHREPLQQLTTRKSRLRSTQLKTLYLHHSTTLKLLMQSLAKAISLPLS